MLKMGRWMKLKTRISKSHQFTDSPNWSMSHKLARHQHFSYRGPVGVFLSRQKGIYRPETCVAFQRISFQLCANLCKQKSSRSSNDFCDLRAMYCKKTCPFERTR